MVYDPLGRLWQTSSPSYGVTQYLHDGEQAVVEYDGSTASIRRRFFWGPGVDEPILQDEGGNLNCSGTVFVQPDRQGSSIAFASCNGVRFAVNAYDEWGIPNASNWGRYQYTGQAWLPELGMYYYKARLYSPTLGRFLQTDPVGYSDQINLYAYVGDDPTNAVDPTGMECTGSLIQGADGACKGATWEGASSVNRNLAGAGTSDGPVEGSKPGGSGQQSTGGAQGSSGSSPSLQQAGLLAGDHEYTAGPNLICPASWGCTADQVGAVYTKASNAIPGNTGNDQVISGHSYTVRLAGVPVGEVQSFVGKDRLTVNNITHWDHVLAMGWANRNVYQSGGNWYSYTHGVGTNYWGGGIMATINQLAGPGIFNSLDRSISKQLYDLTHR